MERRFAAFIFLTFRRKPSSSSVNKKIQLLKPSHVLLLPGQPAEGPPGRCCFLPRGAGRRSPRLTAAPAKHATSRCCLINDANPESTHGRGSRVAPDLGRDSEVDLGRDPEPHFFLFLILGITNIYTTNTSSPHERYM